jgi:hypothetical protein
MQLFDYEIVSDVLLLLQVIFSQSNTYNISITGEIVIHINHSLTQDRGIRSSRNRTFPFQTHNPLREIQ